MKSTGFTSFARFVAAAGLTVAAWCVYADTPPAPPTTPPTTPPPAPPTNPGSPILPPTTPPSQPPPGPPTTPQPPVTPPTTPPVTPPQTPTTPSTPSLVLSVQDLWWGGSRENGWGMSLVQHGEKLFAVIYAYDSQSRPVWYVMSGGTWDASKRTYSGSLYLPTGTPYYAYDISRFAVNPSVGTARLQFTDADNGTLNVTINGASVQKTISRNFFGPVAAQLGVNYGDMWWGGAAQNGWGVAVLQQNRTLFAVWYTYDAQGAPTWFVMPGGSWNGDTYSGRMYQTSGSNWVGTYDPTRLVVNDVGTYSMRFTGESTGTFTYTVGSRTGTIPLSRLGF